MVLEASRLDDIVEQVVRTLEFAVLAKYAFGLAQLFNSFYHHAQILNENADDVRPVAGRRRWRISGQQADPRARFNGRCRSGANVGR
jgi:hypothetical protein